jgi:hypothetical protein
MTNTLFLVYLIALALWAFAFAIITPLLFTLQQKQRQQMTMEARGEKNKV